MGKNRQGLTKEQRKVIRFQRARRWLGTYSGGQCGLLKAYMAHFRVDHDCAARDILEMNALYPAVQAECKREEEARRQKHQEDKQRRRNAA